MTVLGDDGLARPEWAATDPLMKEYYDTEWGMPVRDERGLFERLSLEAFQSGLGSHGLRHCRRPLHRHRRPRSRAHVGGRLPAPVGRRLLIPAHPDGRHPGRHVHRILLP